MSVAFADVKAAVRTFYAADEAVAGQLLQNLGKELLWNLQRIGNFSYAQVPAKNLLFRHINHCPNGVLTALCEHRLLFE